MKKALVVGNWKMHLNLADSKKLALATQRQVEPYLDKAEVVLCPSNIALAVVAKAAPKLSLGVQNVYYADEGAFTGEVAAVQVKDMAKYAILGHSERRRIFGESSEVVARKAAACVRSGITPIICVGETEYEREHNETVQVLNDQVSASLTMLTASEVKELVIAYEPVWAIGSNHNAKPSDVAAAIKTIKKVLLEMFGEEAADACRFLYGGSVAADTAASYIEVDEINGYLVGGASLNAHEFSAIVERGCGGK